MATKNKTAAKPAAKKAAPKAAEKEFKFGVPELAKELGILDSSARVALRNKGIKKNGRSYGWDTREDMLKVAAKLAPEDKAPAKKAAPAKKKK